MRSGLANANERLGLASALITKSEHAAGPNANVVQVATCTKAIRGHGSPNGAIHRCLGMSRRVCSQLRLHTGIWVRPGVWDPETVLHTGVGIPNWCDTGVWISKQGYTWVFGVPNGRSCKLPFSAAHPKDILPHYSSCLRDTAL